MELRELKDKRLNAGLSQTKLANNIGIKRSSLSLLESGKRKPSYDVMERIAKVFDEPFVIK